VARFLLQWGIFIGLSLFSWSLRAQGTISETHSAPLCALKLAKLFTSNGITDWDKHPEEFEALLNAAKEAHDPLNSPKLRIIAIRQLSTIYFSLKPTSDRRTEIKNALRAISTEEATPSSEAELQLRQIELIEKHMASKVKP